MATMMLIAQSKIEMNIFKNDTSVTKAVKQLWITSITKDEKI